METLTENNFGTGGVPSPADPRDYDWALLGASAVPFSWELGYDVEKKLPRSISLKNQGPSSSCGGQAVAYKGEVIEAIATGTQEERSAKFIYAQTHIGSGGSFLRDNCEIAVKQGWAKEEVLNSYPLEDRFDTTTGAPLGKIPVPPDEAFMTRVEDITPAVKEDASSAQAMSYATVDRLSIDAVAQAIANNHGAIILIQGENNGTWLSEFPKPTTGTDTWNHFLYCGKAKLINGKKYIGAKNSWGDVGDHGWQWISGDFFTSGHILEVRTMLFNNKPPQFQFTKDLRIGMRNGDVLQLQHRLVKNGVAKFAPTGYFGVLTLAAVIAYQKRNGITPPFGFVGPITRARLNLPIA